MQQQVLQSNLINSDRLMPVSETVAQWVTTLPTHPLQKLAFEMIERGQNTQATDAHSRNAADDAAITAAAGMLNT